MLARYKTNYRGDFYIDENGPWVKASDVLSNAASNFLNLVEVEALLLKGVDLLTDAIEYGAAWPEAQAWVLEVAGLGLDYIEGVNDD